MCSSPRGLRWAESLRFLMSVTALLSRLVRTTERLSIAVPRIEIGAKKGRETSVGSAVAL